MSHIGRHTSSASSQKVEVGPGSTVKLSVYAPNLTANLDEVRLKLNGREIVLTDRSGSDFMHVSGPFLGPESSLTFFASPDINIVAMQQKIESFGLVGAINSYSFGSRGYSSSSYYGQFENLEVIEAPPSNQWEESWLAYTAFANLLMTPVSYDALSGPSKDAVRDYVGAGGVITFFEHKGKIPDRFEGPLRSKEYVVESRRGRATRLKYFAYGMGYVIYTNQYSTDLNEEDWYGLLSMERRQFYQSADSGYPERNLPLFDEKGVNKNLIYWGVFFFVVVVGPVNLILCRYYFSNLMLLVITTPAFSVLVSLLFVVGDYVSQGTRPTTVTETFTILDQRSNRSISFGRIGFYTPMRAGELKFDLQTEVLPYIGNDTIERHYYRGRMSEPSTIRFEDNAQFLSSGWVQARQETYFNFRQVKRSDLKVDIQKNAEGNLEAINGLGVDIVRFLYQDTEGKPYFAESIKAGEKIVLERVAGNQLEGKEKSMANRMYALRPGSGRDVFEDLFISGRLGLRHYIAETDSSPFSEPVQTRTIEKPATSFIYGILEEANQ